MTVWDRILVSLWTFTFSVVVESPSRIWLFESPWTVACQASLSLTISWHLPKFMFISPVMPSSRLILWPPLLLLPLVFPSIRDFSSESSVHIRWPKYWSFSISVSPSSEFSGLISFRIDWFDSPAVQGTFQESSLVPQFEGINSLVFCLLYGPALTTIPDNWEDHSLDYAWTCEGREMSLLSTP